MKVLNIALTISILIAVYPGSMLALDANHDSNQKLRRWSVSVYLGSASSGPAKEWEKAMMAHGFNQTCVIDWFPFGGISQTTYPFSETGIARYRLPWMLNVHYSLNPLLGVGLVYSNTKIGDTAGYKETTGRFDVEYSVNTFSPVVSVQAMGFQFGIGPAFYMTNSIGKRLSTGEIFGEKKTRKIGLLIDFGLAIPSSKSRLFFEIKIQYRAIGKVEVGPYEIETTEDLVIFPASNINYNHWFLGAGLGIRF